MTRALTALLLAALPAAAGAATYTAKPVQPVAAKRIIAKDISWQCAAGGCRGTTEESRPLVLCQGLAKKAGRIDSFLVDGRALGANELEKCNAAAPAGAGAAPVQAAN